MATPMHETPVLINVSDNNFEDYINNLSSNTRSNFRRLEKRNKDITHSRIEYNRELMLNFIALWEQQDLGGRKRQYNLGINFIEFLNRRGQLICLAASAADNPQNIIALHVVENHDGYVDCHAPMYDKTLYADRRIGKYMWFSLIKYAMTDPELIWLDFAGGNRGSWRDLLYLDFSTRSYYKWMFVPESVKKNPENEKPYRVHLSILQYRKRLIESEKRQLTLWRNCVHIYVTWVWVYDGQRIERVRNFLNRVVRKLSRGKIDRVRDKVGS